MKVVLLCHFSTKEIRKHIPLVSLGLQNTFNGFVKKGKHNYIDYGRWVVDIIDGLKDRKDIELFVIAPHYGLAKKTYQFEKNSVKYYFYRPEPLFPYNYLEELFFSQRRKGYPRTRKIVSSFISSIKPDLVNLIGAENPYYSITALDIVDMPVFLHCQTVYANPERLKKVGKVDKLRWETELQLFHHIPYYACTGEKYYELIKGYEPNAIIFPRYWPVSKFPDIKEVNKCYDFVFFARFLNRNKGFDNAIEAMGIAIKKHPELRFLAVGNTDSDWGIFEKRIKELRIDKNLTIHPSFQNYVEMLQFVKQGRFALLPIKMDVISGTILEAMQMGMPVITSRTTGTPKLNSKRRCVLISEIGDNDGLAKHIIELYENSELEDMLRRNSFSYIMEEDEKSRRNVEYMVAQYYAVVEHFYHGVPVPENLLFQNN